MDQNSELQELQQKRREARRKRRIRNQIAAYAVVIVLIAALATGIVFGIQYLRGSAATQEQERQEQLEEILASEETIPEPVAEPSTEPVIELTPQQKLDEIINARIEMMPLEDKVAGLFIVTPESITGVNAAVKAGDGTKEALTKYAVGGIIYSEKNIQSAAQFREMIDNTKLYANYPLFIAIEEEGGTVSPMQKKSLMDKTKDAQEIAATGEVNNAYQAGGAIGAKLSEYGFNLDLAPVADLNSVNKSIMGKRSYGSDATAVSAYVTAMLQGLEEQNVNTCLKHFPGMGSTTQDTDKGLASTDRSLDDFRANEFVVFRAGIEAGADMVMVSNMAAPALAGDNTPCSMSDAVVTNLLRSELKYDGVIITDAMNMKAISNYYGADEAAVRALRAGCDMILMPEDFKKAYEGVLTAVQNGEISEERVNDALRRIYRVKDAAKLEEQ